MPTLDMNDNIKRLEETIEQMTQEIFRLKECFKPSLI